ncbi:MAG: CHAT domain-containing protein, partial [Armatimonadota bacterium]
MAHVLAGVGDHARAAEGARMALRVSTYEKGGVWGIPERAASLLLWSLLADGDDAEALRWVLTAADKWMQTRPDWRTRPAPVSALLTDWLHGVHYLRAEPLVEEVLWALRAVLPLSVREDSYGVFPATLGLERPGWTADLISVLGVARYYRGELNEAEALLRQALRCEPSPRYSQAQTHLWLGRVLLAKGQIQQSEAELNRGWAGEEDAQWWQQRDYADARLQYAVAKLQVGEAEEGERLARQVLETVSKDERIAEQLQALGVLAAALDSQGKAQEAARAGEQATQIAQQLAHREARLGAASLLAGLYASLGAEELAEAAAGRSGGRLWLRDRTTESLRREAQVRAVQGEPEKAERALTVAMKIDKLVGNRARLADDLFTLGALAGRRAEHTKAERLLQEAVDAARGVGYTAREAHALVELMAVRLAQEQADRAAELSEAVDRLSEELKLAPLQMRVGMVQGWLAEEQGDHSGALRRYVGAADALERMRAGLAVEALHIGLLESRAGVHQRLVSLLVRMAQDGEELGDELLGSRDPGLLALHYAEAGRARALLGRMRGVFVSDLSGMEKADAAELDRARAAVATARQALWAEMAKEEPEQEALDKLAAEVRKAQAASDALRDRLLTKYPAETLRAGREEALAPLETVQVCAEHDCAALEYWVGEDESWAWSVSPSDPEVKLFRIGKGREELAELVGRLQRAMTRTPPATPMAEAILRQLAEVLLPAGDSALPPDKRLVILPDGPLYDLPFGLLPYEGKQLIERAPLIYLPSLSVLRALGKASWPTAQEAQISVFARPNSPDPRAVDLPGTEKEAEAIARVVGDGVTALVGDGATETAAKRAAQECDVLHLAAHGLLDRRQPAHSAILLSAGGADDGLLEPMEIAALPIRSRLVVLSACRSAGGGYVAGE